MKLAANVGGIWPGHAETWTLGVLEHRQTGCVLATHFTDQATLVSKFSEVHCPIVVLGGTWMNSTLPCRARRSQGPGRGCWPCEQRTGIRRLLHGPRLSDERGCVERVSRVCELCGPVRQPLLP